MPWNGSGVFNRTTGLFTGPTVWNSTFLDDRDVRSDDHDTHDEDIATGLENTVTRDGQNQPSANLPMAGFRHTGVGNAVARNDYLAAGQLQDQSLTHIAPAAVGGTGDAITLSPTPSITAYAAGQNWSFVAEAANTGATTIDVSSLGTKAVQKLGIALSAGDIAIGDLLVVEYDGTQFQLLSPVKNPVVTSLVDTNGNETLILGETASAVNEITATNAATGNAPSLAATGGDTNIDLLLSPKGTGVVQLGGNLDPNGNSITDGDGLELLSFGETASAVNEVTVTNAATAGAPDIAATGDDTNIDLTLTPKGTGTVLADGTIAGNILETEQATTSGTAFDFTGIPSTARRITFMFEGVSLSGTDDLLVQIGDSGGVETTGYVSSGSRVGGSSAITTSTSGFAIFVQTAAGLVSGHMVLTNISGDGLTWISSHSAKQSTGNSLVGGGDKTLSAVLDRVRLTRSGTNTFDAGSINILIE